jgi:hypothetical protein
MLTIAMCVAWIDWTVVPACADPLYMLQPPREERPAVNTTAPLPAPLDKDEARRLEEFAALYVDRIEVEGRDPDKPRRAPGTLEQRFAHALNAGNPEVGGGQIRHGTYYDGFLYWGSDPLSFLYYNIRNRLLE